MDQTCDERIERSLKGRLRDISMMLAQHDYDALNEYGLSFDYVPPGTWGDETRGFFRWQLSWGGPGDEFRFFADAPYDDAYYIEYWFMDWFDGAHRDVSNDDTIQQLFGYLGGFDLTRMVREATA